MSYLIGVDSGGTHTNVLIVDAEGHEKSVPEIDSSLTSNRGDEELSEVLDTLFTEVLSRTGDGVSSMWINAAGYSAPTKDRFDGLLERAAGEFNGPIGIANDAVSILLAQDEELVVVIAGTGSVALARRPAGDVIVRGGDEWVLADWGSAFWIGLRGLRAAYEALEGGDETALVSSFKEEFMPRRRRKATPETISKVARDLAALGTDTKPVIAAFAQQVTRQAELGDKPAQAIVKDGVNELARTAVRVYRELAILAHPRPLVPRFLVSGSVAYLSPLYKESFSASLSESLFPERASIGQLEVTHQRNGLRDAVRLAGCIANAQPLPALDSCHPHAIIAQ